MRQLISKRIAILSTISILIILIAGFSAFFSPSANENSTKQATEMDSMGMGATDPVLLNISGVLHAFWIGSDTSDRHYILHCVEVNGVWSPPETITNPPSNPHEIYALSLNNTAIIAWAERGGPGSIYYLISFDSGETWSSPIFLMAGDYPQLWNDGSRIEMLSYNRYAKEHMISVFNGTDWNSTPVNAMGHSLPPLLYPIHWNGQNLLFWVQDGRVAYAFLESKGNEMTRFDNISSGREVSEIEISASPTDINIVFSSLTRNNKTLWAISSFDAQEWGTPLYIGRVSISSAFSAYSNKASFRVVWSDENTTFVRDVPNGKYIKILPAGDSFDMCGSTILLSSRAGSASTLYYFRIS